MNTDLFQQSALINGKWLKLTETIKVTNPANNAEIGCIPKCGSQEIADAIESSSQAFEKWKSVVPYNRSQLLRKWHALIMENIQDLALIMTMEQGKPLADATQEIQYAASFLEWFSEEAVRVYGEILPSPYKSQNLVVSIRQPIGVTACITPWNFPMAMITRKAGAALAAGCTMIVKPSSKTPFTAIAALKLAEKAGFPPGVLNLITGDAKSISEQLATDPRVRLISFTGSTRVGKEIMANCSKNLTKVALELGGNAPFIVFEDANLEKAVEGAITSKLRNNGQTCVSPNRFYVHAKVYDEFAKKLTAGVRLKKVGDGTDPSTDLGPLIDDKAVEKIKDHISDALSKGAKLYEGSGEVIPPRFLRPVILTDVPTSAKISKEETFGPVFALYKFDKEEVAVAMANDTNYGLASYVYTDQLSRTIRVGEALQYGMVGVNTGVISLAAAPFGGIKESGIGREGSKHGIDEYTEIKFLNID